MLRNTDISLKEEFITYLKKQENALSLEGNHPFELEGAQRIWLIVEGSVDVFALKQTENPSARYYLFSATGGDLLFGVDFSHLGYALLAVPLPGTKIIQFTAHTFSSLSQNPRFSPIIIYQIEDLVSKIGRVVAGAERPPIDQFIIENQSYSFPAQQIISTETSLVWCEVKQGSLSFLGSPEIILNSSSPPFPSGKGFWFQTEEKCSLNTFSTSELIRKDPSLQGLELVKEVYIRWVSEQIQSHIDQELRRIQRQHALESQATETALRELASVMDEEKVSEISEEPHPLLTALKRITHFLGISITFPPHIYEAAQTLSLESLCQILRLKYRRVLLREDWWRKDAGPLLGFYKKTPVALIPGKPGQYTAFFPNQKKLSVSSRIAEQFDPQAYMIYKPFPPQTLSLKDIFLFAKDFLIGDLKTILWTSGLIAFLGLLPPYLTGIIFNEVIPDADQINLSHLLLALFSATFSVTLFDFVRSIGLIRIRDKWGLLIQSALWDRLISLPLTFFRRYTVGDLMKRLQGIEQIRVMLSGPTLIALISGVAALFQFFLLFYYSVPLAFAALGITLLFSLIFFICGLYSFHFEKQLHEIAGKLSGFLFQIINGIPKLKVTGSEKRAFAEWAKRFHEERRVAFRAGQFQNYVMILNAFLPSLATLVIFWLIDFLAKDPGSSKLSVGSFVAFTSSFSILLSSATGLSETAIGLVSLLPVIRRVQPLLSEPPETDPLKIEISQLDGYIEMSHVSFRYHEDGPLILDDVSWSANPGEFIAFVGPSGSGKSTILKLLLGFEKTTVGNIYIDGRDINTIDITSLRRKMGVVLQNSSLHTGTILENIVGSTHYTIEDAWRAAELAGIAQDIREMPMGMHTVLNVGGSSLSGGQRQRILIARALVANPKVIIFDEATSALDNRTQQIVSESLDRLNVTRIVVAHRLSTIRNADRIYVLSGGKIVQSGTYEELASREGLFRELIKRQTLETNSTESS